MTTPENPITREVVYLAGLLHDIGKFWQRADALWNQPNRLTQPTQQLAGVISHITDRGTPSHQHVYWTNQFLTDHEDVFRKLGVWTEARDSLLNLAANHHRPQTDLQALVSLADSWASGLDRAEAKPDDDQEATSGEIKWGWNRYKRLPLVNMLTRMHINGQVPRHSESQSRVFRLRPLALDEPSVSSRPLGQHPPDLTSDYQALWKQFVEDFEKLPAGNLAVFTDSLHHLLRKYTWCIPADTTQEFCDMSLFHHLKMVGALAQCLFDHRAEQPALYAFDGKRLNLKDGYPLQLLCVDLSGIQGYIYNIASKYAAKSLKGRSFSLQMLLDGIAQRLVAATRTTQSHIVYSSGGKFFMLLPNTDEVNGTLENLEKTIQQEVWDEFQGNLFVCFGRITFAYDNRVKQLRADIDGRAETISLGTAPGTQAKGLWSRVADKAAAQKQQKNHALLLDETRFEHLFGAAGNGGAARQCAVTGLEEGLKTTGGMVVHQSVHDQIKIGNELAGHCFLVTGRNGDYGLLPGNEKFSFDTPLQPGTERCLTLQPPAADGPDENFIGTSPQAAYSFRFYGGSRPALRPETKEPKHFEELAGIVRQNRDEEDSPVVAGQCEGGYNRLAVLRMDVDSLGDLFTKGFAPERASFSAYATLSGLLDWFFSGYLNTLRERDEFHDWVNIIYSGGDDVFAVGRWNRIIGFADTVQREFKAFAGRDDLTISAGIELMRPRFPIGKAAEAAGDAEDRAKDHAFGGQRKNAVCLFGLAVNWHKEWPAVVAWKNKLAGWLRGGQLSKGILQKLFAYYNIHRAKPEDLSWKWNAAYILARHRRPDNAAVMDELKILLFTEINPNKMRFEAFAIALRWAELEYRDNP